MNFQTMSKQRKFVLIAAAAGVIGTFLPWVSVFGFSVNGLHGFGIFIFLCFIVAGALAFMGDQTKNLDKTNWMITLIAGGLAALIMVINLLNSIDGFSFLGIGFYIDLLASIGVLAAAFLFRTPGDTIKGGFDSFKKDMNDKMKNTGSNSSNTNNPGNTNPPL